MARSRGFPLRSRVPKRRKGWELGPGDAGRQVVLASATAVIAVSGAQLLQDGLTLLRTRGSLTFLLTGTGSIADGLSGAIGMGIVRLPAFNVGVTAVPTPITEQDWDGWLWWHAFSMRSVTSTIADGANAAGISDRVIIDTKAMRKLDEDDVLYFAIETVDEVSTAVLQWHIDTRVLLALP